LCRGLCFGVPLFLALEFARFGVGFARCLVCVDARLDTC
jgi:hypothetical protein